MLDVRLKRIKREQENVQKVADIGAFCHVYINSRSIDL